MAFNRRGQAVTTVPSSTRCPLAKRHPPSAFLPSAVPTAHCLLSAARHPPFAIRMLSAVHRPLSSVIRQPSSVRRPPSTVRRHPPTVHRPPSTVHLPPSTVSRHPSSTKATDTAADTAGDRNKFDSDREARWRLKLVDDAG